MKTKLLIAIVSIISVVSVATAVAGYTNNNTTAAVPANTLCIGISDWAESLI